MFEYLLCMQKLDESNKAHTINLAALLLLLESKGIITEEEFQHARAVATGPIDQHWAAMKEKLQKGGD